MTRPAATSAVTIACAIGLLLTGCRDRSPAPAEQPTISAAPPAPISAPSTPLALPMKVGSVRFAAIGDAGRGNAAQYAVSAQMQAYRRVFPYTFVVMLGDNVYDGGTPEDYRLKFEQPYKPLLDAGVPFYATIGSHDDLNQPNYAPFHMEGRRYYTFTAPALAVTRPLGSNVRFFMIDTERLDREELAWIDREMEKSGEDWKIPIFHRPIYTSGRYARPARWLRSALEPIFLEHGVSVAFSGHEHFYERIKPQQGITYFISGGAGSLRAGDIRPTPLTDVGFDRGFHFMLIEIAGDELYFQAISEMGATIDQGTVRRREFRRPSRETPAPTR